MISSSRTATTDTTRTKLPDVEPLLRDYAKVCNRAIVENEDRFLFQQAKKLNRALWGETDFRTLVYDQDPTDVIHEAMLHFDPERRVLSVHRSPRDEVAFTWKVPLAYLEDVVRNRPEWYVKNAVMLDWVWATARLRDEAHRVADNRSTRARVAAGVAAGAVIGATVVWAASRVNGR